MEYAKSFQANGKLLLTGEYIVLESAKALSFPTKLGQELRVSFVPQSQFILQWQSFDHENNLWFEATFDTQLIAQNDDSPVAANLSKLLQIAFENNPLAIGRYYVSTHLAFPREWGLGSSSSLIALLSKWSGCDPYRLFYNTQNGSGYDVASALCDTPILFQRNGLSPVVQPVIWQP
ncbi:MAG: hypothetical protein LAT76_01735, partial [Schleiferiaceae bacterium]|nr:hypothetical protein [Schleiferiaceae bacterium]